MLAATLLPYRALVAGTAIHDHTPHTSRAGGAGRDGHPGRVKREGAAGEQKKDGDWNKFIMSNKKDRLLALPLLRTVRQAV
jgi:hypothetical protein